MILLDRLLIAGIRFSLEKVVQAAEAQLDDPERLKEELLLAQTRLEAGELSEEEFVAIEADVLARMRALRADREGPRPGDKGVTFAGAEASFVADEEHEG